ncbi:hypothetical protein N9805_05120 [Paracoccaceae bacterium]|nr:hypothetical protein [Paracoccaceae bacterium]
MRKLLIVLFSLAYSVNGAWAEDQFALSAFGVDGTVVISKNNMTKKTTVVLRTITNHSGVSSNSYLDHENGLFFIGDGSNGFTIYDYVNDTYTQTGSQANGQAKYAIPFGTAAAGSGVVTAGTDTDGNATTVVASSNIVGADGKTIIETKADGSTHIGENSLVTKEVNGAQSLYATDAKGKAIPININNGSSLQVNGVDVMDKIDGTVALSSAMSALPNSSDDAAGTCGMGTGFHKGLSAISAGCAIDFATLTQNSDLSPLFKRASVNLGTSAIMNSKGFSNFALRAGLTFKLGAKKSSGSTLSMDEDLQRYSTGTNTRIADLKKENDTLRAEMDALNAKLDALIASLNNG